ncbi:unnamed protein product [Natator depressus]
MTPLPPAPQAVFLHHPRDPVGHRASQTEPGHPDHGPGHQLFHLPGVRAGAPQALGAAPRLPLPGGAAAGLLQDPRLALRHQRGGCPCGASTRAGRTPCAPRPPRCCAWHGPWTRPTARTRRRCPCCRRLWSLRAPGPNRCWPGQGIDRHLLGLKLAAIGDGQRLPGIFMDTAYAIATHCRLLTGQVSSRSDCLMVYGPQVPDGYGVCYNPLDAHVNFAITAFNCCHETHARRLARALHRVLDQLACLLGESPGGGDVEGQP